MTIDQEDLLRKAHRSLEAARLLLEHAAAFIHAGKKLMGPLPGE